MNLESSIKAAILRVAHAELGPEVSDLGDLNFWTPEQWDNERGEPYGRRALLTATFEGPIYALMNTGTGFPDKLVTALDTLGVYYEQGFAWSLHVYPKCARVAAAAGNLR